VSRWPVICSGPASKSVRPDFRPGSACTYRASLRENNRTVWAQPHQRAERHPILSPSPRFGIEAGMVPEIRTVSIPVAVKPNAP
jgi:hypothetical protein